MYGTANTDTPTQVSQITMITNKKLRLRFIFLRLKYTTAPANKVSTMNSMTGCSTNVATTKAPNEKPTINIHPGNPSRYMTIKKAPYTSASPVSFCATDK